MITLPQNLRREIMIGQTLSPDLANRMAADLDFESRLAALDGRADHAEKLAGYAAALRKAASALPASV